jgi:hypothetical protein
VFSARCFPCSSLTCASGCMRMGPFFSPMSQRQSVSSSDHIFSARVPVTHLCSYAWGYGGSGALGLGSCSSAYVYPAWHERS